MLHFRAYFAVHNREYNLDAVVQISCHPVGGAEVETLFAVRMEAENARVL